MATPAADVDIDEALVRGLLQSQRPDLAELPIRVVANGWDNAIVRLGDEWMVRLPRRAAAAALIESEQRWLVELAPRLPLPIPVPVFAGLPTAAYPWKWSLCPWFDGESAATAPPRDARATAHALAGFIAALHRPAPVDAPANPFRGVALTTRAAAVGERARSLAEVIHLERTLGVWRDLSATPTWHEAPVWLHGDLHPSNMLTRHGELSAVIDWGDLTAGDPATDLAIAWMLFDAQQRDLFRQLAGIDVNTWRRAAGWALNLSLAYLTGDDSTSMPAIGRHTLDEVLAEFS